MNGIVLQTIFQEQSRFSFLVSIKIGTNEPIAHFIPPTFSLINAKSALIRLGAIRATFNDVARVFVVLSAHKSEISNCSRKWVLITRVGTLYALLTSA